GEAARDHHERLGIGAGDSSNGLAVGEVGLARHRAGVDDIDLRGLLRLHGAVACLLGEDAHLLRLDLVQPATEGGEGDGRGRAHAVSASLSWRGGAPVSPPVLQRRVVGMPASSRIDWKARMRWSGGRWKPEPSQSLNGMRLTLARTPLRRRTSRRASSAESLTRSRSTYSKVMRWRKATGKPRQASSSSSMAKPLFTGMIRFRIWLLVACSEMARLTLRLSLASFSMPLTRPTVDTVMRRGEKPNALGSVRIRSDW